MYENIIHVDFIIMSKDEEHYRKLENMYHSAPINKIINSMVKIEKEKAIVTIEGKQELYHAAGAIHGSIYFKALDDSAYFAVNSIVLDVFVLTTNFNTYLTKPVSEGDLKAEGRLVFHNKSQFIAESIIYDSMENEIGRGIGMFVKGKINLTDVPGYK